VAVDVETVARALNVSPRRVQQLAAEGLPRIAKGEYDLGACMAWYIKYLQRVIEQRARDDGTSVSSLTSERIRGAREAADKAAIDNRRRRGELIETEFVGALLRDLAQDISARLEGLPGRLANAIDGIDPNERRARFLAECREIRSGIAVHVAKLAERGAASAGRGGNVPAAAAAPRGRVGKRQPSTAAE
jgi:phage terminase Nu1 subunit (DNA packaging protein)